MLTKKIIGTDDFIGKLSETFKEEIYQFYSIFFPQKLEEETLSNLFHGAKDITRKENCRPTSFMNMDSKILKES